MSLNSHFLSCRPDSLLFPQLQSVLWDRASVRVGEQHAPRQEERRNHEALERVSRSVNTIVLNLTTSLIFITLLLRCHLQPTVDGGRLQQCRRLSLKVLRPLALQAVPRRRGGQRRRSQRHLCQLERIRPGGCERQLPVRLTGGTREKGRKSCTFLSSCLWGGKKTTVDLLETFPHVWSLCFEHKTRKKDSNGGHGSRLNTKGRAFIGQC